jgi:hypothetical protein
MILGPIVKVIVNVIVKKVIAITFLFYPILSVLISQRSSCLID